MPNIQHPVEDNKIVTKQVPLTAYALYTQQVSDVMNAIRSAAKGQQYIPSQFGGLQGQREALMGQNIITNIDFQSTGNNG
jgi:hypothetical protein